MAAPAEPRGTSEDRPPRLITTRSLVILLIAALGAVGIGTATATLLGLWPGISAGGITLLTFAHKLNQLVE